MPRPLVHAVDSVLDAARDLVLADGPRAAGIRAIAQTSGAPTGSLYHRFGSRDAVVAQAWLRAVRRFQRGFADALEEVDERTAVARAASWTVTFALDHPDDATLLLTHSARSLLDAEPSADVARALQDVNAQVVPLLRALASRLYGKVDAAGLERVTHAVVDLPYAAVRRHLTNGTLRPSVAASVAAAASAIVRAH